MQPVVTFPSWPEEFVNLHEALQALMPPKSDYFMPAGAYPTRDDLVKLAEWIGREGENYGAYTSKAIGFFQLQERIKGSSDDKYYGRVDVPTADRLNLYLWDAGAFDPPDYRIVRGVVSYAASGGNAGAPAPGVPVHLFDESGTRTVRLASTQSGASGQYEIGFTFGREQRRWVGVPATAGGYDPKDELERGTEKFIRAEDLPVPAAAADEPFTVQGTVRRPLGDPQAGQPVSGVVVSVFVASEGNRRLASSPPTDAAGAYSITSAAGPAATLLVGIEGNGSLIVRSGIWINQGGNKVQDLELASLAGAGPYIVRGRVTGLLPDGGVLVRAYDKDIRSEEFLGEMRPGSDGLYEIAYRLEDFERVERPGGGADLRMRVYDAQGLELPVTALRIPNKPYNAPSVAEIHLLVGARDGLGPSEFERYLATIEPVRDGVAIAEFTAEDVEFVAGETDIDEQHVAWLQLAHALAASSGTGAAIPAAAYYGWFRKGQPTLLSALAEVPTPALEAALRWAVRRNIVPAALAANIAAIVAAVQNVPRATLVDVLAPLNLPPRASAALAIGAGMVNEVSHGLVSNLVGYGSLPSDAAQDLGLAVSLHSLLGQQTVAAERIRIMTFPRLPGFQLRSPRDLARLSLDDWAAALLVGGATPPQGSDIPGYAAQISRTVAKAFPADYLLYRVTDAGDPSVAWKALQPLRRRNPELLNRTFDGLDKSSIGTIAQPELMRQHAQVKRFVNLHPGLGLDKVLHDNADPDQGIRLANQRVAWLAEVQRANQGNVGRADGVDLLAVDYLPRSENLAQVRWGNLAEDQKPPVISSLKAYQRLHLVTGDSYGSEALLGAGLHSAAAVARTPVSDIVARTGLAFDEVVSYRANADRLAERAALTWFALHDAERDSRVYPPSIVSKLPADYLQDLPGYAQMFGSVDSCNCDPCLSMLSPAAYFVDLLHYVERALLERPYTRAGDGYELPNGLPEADPLHLKNRRPDLWTLPLTCENTQEFVPTLQVALEVLERFIAQAKGIPADDRQMLFALLADMDRSPRQPFHLPLTRLDLLLKHFGASRHHIASLLAPPDAPRVDTTPARMTRSRARLSLSIRAAQRIVGTRLTDISSAAALYTAWTASDTPLQALADAEINDIPVRPLMHAMGLDRDTLVGLARCKFVSADGSSLDPVTTRSVARIPGAVQNDTELLMHLSIRRLERIEVFLRLWRSLEWTIAELDYVLQRLIESATRPGGSAAPLHEGIVIALVQLLDLQSRWNLPVDELCALWSDVPGTPLRDAKSLWDRRFNLRPFADADGPLPPPDVSDPSSFFRPGALSPDGRAMPADRTQQRLAAALQVPDTNLVALFLGLEPCFTGAASNDNPRLVHLPIPLTRFNLTLLYRHALLARQLGVSVPDLIELMALTPTIGDRTDASQRCVRGLDDLLALLAMHDWVVRSGFDLGQIRAICRTDGQAIEAKAVAAQIVQRVRDDAALFFADTVFTQIGLNDAQSRAIVLANSAPAGALIEPVPGSSGSLYRLKSDVDWGRASAPRLSIEGVVSADELRAWLAPHVMTIAARGEFTEASFTELGLDTDTWRTKVIDENTGPDKVFESTGTNRFRLRAQFRSTLSLQKLVPTQLMEVLNGQCRMLLIRYDSIRVLEVGLATALQCSPTTADLLMRLVYERTRPPGVAEALHGGSIEPLETSLGEVLRRSSLLGDSVFSPVAIAFIAERPEVFQLSRTGAISTEAVRIVAIYTQLAGPPDPAYSPRATPSDPAALLDRAGMESLVHVQGQRSEVIDLDAASPIVARALALDVSIVRPLLYQLTQTLDRKLKGLDGLQVLRDAARLVQSLGMSPEVLALAVSNPQEAADEYADLARAAEGAYGAFRSKYLEQQAFDQKLEPFEDKLRSLTRDALVECLLHDVVPDWRRRFQTNNDLFDHFLMDVMVEGCARTSRLVAAISSVQLYVQRVLMHLEQTAEDGSGQTLRIAFASDASGDGQKLAAEWSWRQHYRVWEANRKVFLYPENYIEPGLRDDKSPLFKALEDVLLQQEIGPQSALDAYAEYLAGLDEIAGLKVAGAYHDRTDGADTLHLFGVSSSEPPVYYYRTIFQLETPATTRYKPWEKLDLQIPVRVVSPIVMQGRLVVLWVETVTRALSDIKGGGSQFKGYRHTVRIKFTQLRLDGRWSPPQTIRMNDAGGFGAEGLLIEDPITLVTRPSLATILQVQALNRISVRPLAGEPSQRPIDRPTRNNYDQTGETDPGVELVDFPDPVPQVPAQPPGPISGPVPVVSVRWDERYRVHLEGRDDYVPGGWKWDRPYPTVVSGQSVAGLLFLPTGNDPQLQSVPLPSLLDFRDRTANRLDSESYPTPRAQSRELLAHEKAIETLVLRRRNYQTMGMNYADATFFLHGKVGATERGDTRLLRFNSPAEAQIVNGNEGSAVIHVGGETLLLLNRPGAAPPRYTLRRLGTTLLPQLSSTLASAGGVARLLDTTNQKLLTEHAPPATIEDTNAVLSGIGSTPFDKGNPLAGYFRELYFHIPFLLADHLNSRQKFSDAKYWFDFVFNPSARNEPGDPAVVRPWRYIEFRSPETDDFHKNLTESTALQAYREDPFNPHAIARLRPGAYKKSVVMKYIDNLLDWGDTLFSQFTTESVNESMMLYTMASEILGPRPMVLGPCDEEPVSSSPPPRTYASLKPFLTNASDLLIQECESMQMKLPLAANLHQPTIPFVASWRSRELTWSPSRRAGAASPLVNQAASERTPTMPSSPSGWNRAASTTWMDSGGHALRDAYEGPAPTAGVAMSRLGTDIAVREPLRSSSSAPSMPAMAGVNVPIGKNQDIRAFGPVPARIGPSPMSTAALSDVPAQLNLPDLVSAKTVFCLPANKDLLAYWDRVEDRLFKIRNCMDIAGVRRKMELFAPEIDPKFLVRMRAAGLSLDDVLNATSGHLPPYRFQFLIDKAKQHASMVQSFSSQLLSALEKKDAEELSMLRTVHEQNLLKLRTSMAEWEITAAADTLESLRKQKAVAEHRRDHFQRLSSEGLTGWERTHQVMLHTANLSTAASALLSGTGGIFALIPQLGAPTSMNYGGIQISKAADFWAEVLGDTSRLLQLGASSASLEGSNLRRDQDWQHQSKLADKEIAQIERQIAAAEIRKDIADQSLKVHQRTVDQAQEVYDFLRERFSNFGRYTWLSSQLQKLNRGAYQAALSMARLAEQAFQFERPEDAGASLLSGDYWSAENSGLLAGDRLQLDLQHLERKFIETNYRTLEVEQSFSLLQFNPSALIALRTSSSCRFSVPEALFDSAFPGQYRRRIKAVRLTIPCVIGPYGSIGATLTMTGSWIRNAPDLTTALASVPLRHLTTIAASTAQSDAGVFEFSFRDERYMPYEGAGAVSDWELKLPDKVRPFDYDTISDVILRVAYTAVQDNGLREAVDGVSSVVLDKLREADVSRIFSLRHEFPAAWKKLIHSPIGTDVMFDITPMHLPFFMQDAALDEVVLEVILELATATDLDSQSFTMPTIELNASGTDAFVPDARSNPKRLFTAETRTKRVVQSHALKLTNAGSLAPSSASTPGATLDERLLDDVLIRVTWSA